MLKMTKIKFELILDPDIYTFFEKGTRGPAINIWNLSPKTRIKTSYILRRDQYLWLCNVWNSSNKSIKMDKYSSNSSKGCVLKVEIILNIQKNYETFKWYIQKNNGKLGKHNQCKIRRQRKRILFEMSIKIKLYVA